MCVSEYVTCVLCTEDKDSSLCSASSNHILPPYIAFKVRILVTHGLGFLPQCDLIVVMLDGRITEVGSYSALMESNGAFAEFLRTYSNTDKDEKGVPGN